VYRRGARGCKDWSVSWTELLAVVDEQNAQRDGGAPDYCSFKCRLARDNSISRSRRGGAVAVAAPVGGPSVTDPEYHTGVEPDTTYAIPSTSRSAATTPSHR
jgi:hypothetical protein